MSESPNESTLWARILVEELAAGGLETACIAPGSRSTPLTAAFFRHEEIEVYTHLDERSAAFFALGRGRRTGEPTALVSTSGTAAANFHPAVIEADTARVPLLVLTADRPPELRDSGANQTIDQVELYGDAVRWYAELPEPRPEKRRARSLRTTAARALAETTGLSPGPVHLNCPFQKPLEPSDAPGSIPDSFAESLAGRGREGAFVETTRERPTASTDTCETIAAELADAKRPLIVAGPADPPRSSGTGSNPESVDPMAVCRLAAAVDAPVLADPLSTCRFGPHLERTDALVCGGYDSYASALPDPDVVLRFGASPTSKPLRQYLEASGARQFLVDPVGEWREATFTATDLVAAEPDSVLEGVRKRLEDTRRSNAADGSWSGTFAAAERRHWNVHEATLADDSDGRAVLEGSVLASVLASTPDPATVFVSNSMPVRDADRFGRPRPAELSVLANRGASGIDGITSTALGAGSASPEDEHLVLVTGDLAFYHDGNGLLAIDRCDVDATIVVIDNDGGGIFHMLPIEAFDPPFTEGFKTPHDLAFDALAEYYGLEFERVDPASFDDRFDEAVASAGTRILHVEFDAESSHRRREELVSRVRSGL